MEELLKEFEDEGFEVVVGWREKERKKEMSEAMKKLKESGDENKIMLAKRLARYYGIFHNMGPITTNPDFPSEEDKYGLHYAHCCLENFVDTAKRIITGVIKALADDEPLDTFCKYLSMFTHLYTPEQVKEIEHKEINKRKKKFKEDEVPEVRYHEDDGTIGKDYGISGFGWEKNGRAYINVSEKVGNENDIYEEVVIPVPLILRDDWFRKIREYNRYLFLFLNNYIVDLITKGKFPTKIF